VTYESPAEDVIPYLRFLLVIAVPKSSWPGSALCRFMVANLGRRNPRAKQARLERRIAEQVWWASK